MNIPPAVHSPAPNVMNEIFERLRELDRACGPTANLNDRATVLISACIDEGIDTAPHIIGTIRSLGFNPRHIGKLLYDGTGNGSSGHFWFKDAGTYRNHP